jgi:hypothetical protein
MVTRWCGNTDRLLPQGPPVTVKAAEVSTVAIEAKETILFAKGPMLSIPATRH